MEHFQTLNGFIKNPFNIDISDDRPKEFEDMYQSFKRTNKIEVVLIFFMKGIYMIHVKIPSETNMGNFYDVVIQFSPKNENDDKALNIENYYVKFFSNSPSFVYRYSSLYYANNMLIDSLIDLYDKEALQKMPEKTNSKMELYYDKSIYIACRFLLDHEKQYLSKLAFSFKRTTNFDRFIRNIQDVETISLNANISSIERGLARKLDDTKKSIKVFNTNKTNSATKNRLSNHVSVNGKKMPVAKKRKIEAKKPLRKK